MLIFDHPEYQGLILNLNFNQKYDLWHRTVVNETDLEFPGETQVLKVELFEFQKFWRHHKLHLLLYKQFSNKKTFDNTEIIISNMDQIFAKNLPIENFQNTIEIFPQNKKPI